MTKVGSFDWQDPVFADQHLFSIDWHQQAGFRVQVREQDFWTVRPTVESSLLGEEGVGKSVGFLWGV